jgi:hypothetical protein
MYDNEHFAKFVGYSVYIVASDDTESLSLDVVTNWTLINGESGFISVPAGELTSFLPVLRRQEHVLEQLCSLADGCAEPVTRGRFTAETTSSGIVIKDRMTEGRIHLFVGGSVRELLDQVRRTYRKLQFYIEPCFRIARSIERIPYEEYIAARKRDGFFTTHFHGVARLAGGNVEYRRVGEVAKVYPSADGRVQLEPI